MKKMKLLAWSLIATVLLFTACNNDNDTTPELIRSYSTLIVNQGNYSERNGSLSLYQEATNTVVNLAFEKGNSNRPLASLVESFVHNGQLGLIICNNPSKIEIVDMNDLQAITAPLQGSEVANPRYGVINGSYAYVTCWGKDTEKIGEYPNGRGIVSFTNSYILKINLSSCAIEKTIPCKADAEGIVAYNGKLFAAVAGGVRVFDLTNDSELAFVKHTSLSGNAKQLTVDKNGKLWYTVGSSGLDNVAKGLVCVNTATFTIEKEAAIPAIDGSLAITKAKDKLVYIKSSYYPAAPKAELYTMDVSTKVESATPIYTGTGIIGVAVNPKSGYLYTAEVHNYTTNSTMKVLKEDGTLLYEQQVGIAASWFVFL